MATTLPIGAKVTIRDRRSSFRCKIDQIVYISFGTDNGGFLLDVGERGLRCRVVGALTKGDKCRPKFFLPGAAKPIEADCLIAWTSESQKIGGLKFLDLSEESRLRIREWIAQAEVPTNARKVATPSKMNPIQFGPAVGAALPRSSTAIPERREPVSPVSAVSAVSTSKPKVQPAAIQTAAARPATRNLDQDASVSTPSGTQGRPRIPERDFLTPAPRKTFKLSTAKVVTSLSLIAAALVLAYHFGQTLGFEREASHASEALPTSVAPTSIESPAEADPDQTLPPRPLDPSTADADLDLAVPTSPEIDSTQDASETAVSSRTSASATRKSLGLANKKSGFSTLKSMQPPHLRKRPDGNANSISAGLSDIVVPSTAPSYARPFSFGSVGTAALAPATPPSPVSSGSAFPAATRGPVLIRRVEPSYPPIARESGVEGVVQVRATVGKDGIPNDLVVLKGDPRLSGTALEAIRKWRYRPALAGTDPVEAPVVIMMEFRIRK